MKTSQNSKTQHLALDAIVPYWRNPRKISDEAVNAVARSLDEFGYLQPIVVDDSNVIIIGHTRYSALRRLNYTSAEVIVASDLTSQQVKELRIADNRVAEFSDWDYDILEDEFESLDSQLLDSLFPELAESDIEDLEVSEDDVQVEPEPETLEAVCPHCFHSWEVSAAEVQKLREESNETA